MADDWTGIDFGALDELGEMGDVAADIREPGAEIRSFMNACIIGKLIAGSLITPTIDSVPPPRTA